MNTRAMRKYSVLATAVAAVISHPVYAQEAAQDSALADEDELEIVNVRGSRIDLSNAQNLKRYADKVIDALDASDIGGFPDRSVLEAVSRLPGITMGRFAGANDPDHFGTEGSGINIRGLTFVRSEFNGRDTFTANSARALGFEDVPPELLGSVEVAKNPTADMIEGGIAGTVNLITKKPFDSEGRVFAFSADLTYADFIEKTTPTLSLLYSNSFTNDNGKFGYLLSASHSELEAQSDGAMVGLYFETADGFVPETARLTRKQDERERSGLAAVFQWQSPDDRMRATAEYIRSDARLAWNERAVEFDDNLNLLPVDGTEFEFNDAGYFESGIITSNEGWRGNNGDRTPSGIFGANHVLQTRIQDNESLVEDYSLNVTYAATEALALNFDLQYVDSTSGRLDFSIMNATDAVVGLDLTRGDKPIIDFYAPTYNGGSTDRSSTHFTDPAGTFIRSAMDHVADNEGQQVAAKFDAKYTFDDGIIQSAQAGVRYAKREQITRQSVYNWGNISEAWNTIAWLDGVDNRLYEEVQLDDFSRGGVLTVDGGNAFLFPALSIVNDYRNAFDALSGVNVGGWNTLASRGGADGDFIDNEINETVETNKAAYVRLDFASAWGDTEYSGNFGLRYVNIDNETLGGGLVFPDANYGTIELQDGTFLDIFDLLSEEQQLFSNGAVEQRDSANSFTKVLPSFNLKVELTDGVLLRFGYSKAIALPELGLYREFIAISDEDLFFQAEDTDGDGQLDTVSGATVGRWEADTGNPALKPMESTNIDLTLEYYFAPVGSVTLALFHKDLENYFINGSRIENLTNNGATQAVEIISPSNGDEGTVQGFEIAYQQFYDMLPAPFDGIGVQANYTYVDEEGSPNSNLDADNSDGVATGADVQFAASLPLERLSEHNFNFVVMYEKYGWNARAAYNWRSEYLLTTSDVITNLPVFNEDNGFLDASVFYDLNEDITVGIQGTNLTDEVTQTSMQVDEQGTQRLRGAFVNDRRYSLVIRGVF